MDGGQRKMKKPERHGGLLGGLTLLKGAGFEIGGWGGEGGRGERSEKEEELHGGGELLETEDGGEVEGDVEKDKKTAGSRCED